MFLSKVGEVYYLFFSDESGMQGTRFQQSRKKKSDAMHFLYHFKRDAYEKRKKLKAISFSDFVEQFKVYSSGVHSLKTQKTNTTAFKEFLRVEGNLAAALHWNPRNRTFPQQEKTRSFRMDGTEILWIACLSIRKSCAVELS
jgi:hypothetical protein